MNKAAMSSSDIDRSVAVHYKSLKKDVYMSQDKIDIKDVTPKTFNPKTHKGKGDRFNPNNRIYVRESKGTFQKLRRYGGWFLSLIHI